MKTWITIQFNYIKGMNICRTYCLPKELSVDDMYLHGLKKYEEELIEKDSCVKNFHKYNYAILFYYQEVDKKK